MSTLVLIVIALAMALLLEDWFVTRHRGESVIRRFRERRPLVQRISRGVRVVLVPSKSSTRQPKGKT